MPPVQPCLWCCVSSSLCHKWGSLGTSLNVCASLHWSFSSPFPSDNRVGEHFISDSLTFFFPLADRMTKLISLSICLTGFERTCSHLLPPTVLPSFTYPFISPLLLNGHVRKARLAVYWQRYKILCFFCCSCLSDLFISISCLFFIAATSKMVKEAFYLGHCCGTESETDRI